LKIAAVVAMVASGGALLGISPASGAADNILNIEKVIVGDAPDGDFIVEVDCGMVHQFMFASDGSTGTEQLAPAALTTCVISEPDDLGASNVAFACTVEASTTAAEDTVCVNETTARFGDILGEITFTVTNTFDEPSPAAAEPAAAEVVEATPTFTG